MKFVPDRLRRWYVLTLGTGRAMRESGATLRPCPRCDRETPLYETRYSSEGEPMGFTVCLHCGAHVEFDAETGERHAAYDGASRSRVR